MKYENERPAIRGFLRRVARQKCAHTERWLHGDMVNAHCPGEGDTLCHLECEPCTLRTDARILLRSLGEDAP